MKGRVMRGFVLSLSGALLLSLSAVPAFAKGAAEGPAEETVESKAVAAASGTYEEVKEIYRLYNRSTGEHFYTGNKAERNNLRRVGWVYEGVGWIAPERSDTPVYRLYNPNAGDHHYTTNAAERSYLSSVGWSDEGIGWYSDDQKEAPIYREYNPNAASGAHNFTSDLNEHRNLSSIGWKNEDIGWYSVSAGYSDVNSDYGYTSSTRTHVTRYNGNTCVNSTSLSASSFSYTFGTRSDTAESIDVISDMLDYLEAGKDYQKYEAICFAANRSEAEKVASMYDASVKDFSCGVATLSLSQTIDNVMTAAERDSSIKTAIMPQYIFKISETYLNDPYIQYQWQHEAIDSMTAWDTTRGSGAKICIIDTGCDLDHPDLAKNIKASATFVSGTSSAEDDNGHGTHVAGIAAGIGNNGQGGCGVAPEASLYIAKAGGANGYFQMADIISAMNWAVTKDVDVVNMSLAGYMDGASASYWYGNVLSRFKQNGITLVAAAGNDSVSTAPYPAAFSDAISVAASSDDNGTMAYFSNFGSTVDIVAPGDDILSTYLNGNYEYLSGTSMASPVVAGAVALIYASDTSKFGTDNENAVKLVRNRLLSANDGITYRSSYGSVTTGGLDLTKIFDASNDPYIPEPVPNEPEEPEEPDDNNGGNDTPTPTPPVPDDGDDDNGNNGDNGNGGGNNNPPPGWPDDWPWDWGYDWDYDDDYDWDYDDGNNGNPGNGNDGDNGNGNNGDNGNGNNGGNGDNGNYGGYNYGYYVSSPSVSTSARSGYGIDIVLSSSQGYAIYVDVNGSGYKLYTGTLHYSSPGTYKVSAYCSDGTNTSYVTTATCSFS